MWGSNLPVTRTPDAHWMTEARYRGQKVIAVAPDYADNVKFADEWLPAKPGTDAALAMAMGHVVLKEFFVDRQTPYFTEYVKTYTDLPHLVRLEEAADGEFTAGQVPHRRRPRRPRGRRERCVQDRAHRLRRTGEPVVPNGSLGHRYGEAGVGKWNLELGDVDPTLSLLETAEESVLVRLPRFDTPDGAAADLPRGVPVRRVGGHLVTTVFDLLMAQYGVGRDRPARASGPRRTTTRTRRTPRPGRRRSPAYPPPRQRASVASSPRTPRSPRAAR